LTILLASSGGLNVLLRAHNLHLDGTGLRVGGSLKGDLQYQYRYCNTWPRAIRLIQNGVIDLSKLVTHRYSGHLILANTDDKHLTTELDTPDGGVDTALDTGALLQYQYRYCNTWPRAIRLIQNGVIDLSKLVTHRYSISWVLRRMKGMVISFLPTPMTNTLPPNLTLQMAELPIRLRLASRPKSVPMVSLMP
jgi:hypothetical protein